METELTDEELKALAEIVLERLHATLNDNQLTNEGDEVDEQP